MPPKTPDNQPFEFNLDAFVNGMDLAPFRFPFKGGQWEMRHLDGIDSREVSKAMQAADEDAAMLRLTLGEEKYGELMKLGLPVGGRKELVRRFYKHCGVDLGESQGSINS
jgi:hypothetical protein